MQMVLGHLELPWLAAISGAISYSDSVVLDLVRSGSWWLRVVSTVFVRGRRVRFDPEEVIRVLLCYRLFQVSALGDLVEQSG